MSIICTGEIVTGIINEFGVLVTVRTVTNSAYNIRGDATETTADTSGLKAFIWEMSISDEFVKEGHMVVGDIVFFFDNSNSAVLAIGNRILYDTKWYQIVEINKNNVGTVNYIYEVKTKRI